MSETQRKTFNTRVCGVLLAGACVLLSVSFAFLTPTPQTQTRAASVIAPTQTRRVRITPPPVFETEGSYYRTIIDNNLFRPLGWTPPRPIEPYRLIGTLLPQDTQTPPRVILSSAVDERIHIVSLGDKLDADTEVVAIEGKAVQLSTHGETRTLQLPSGF